MEQLDTRVAYKNPWLSVREDTVRWPDGSTGIYGVIDKRDFALVVPFDGGGFHLVEQYRYPVQERCWEFPQGGWPPGAAGGTGLELAQAELAEETGYRAATWTLLGHLQAAPGVMSQYFDVYLAADLTPGEHAREASEQDMRQRWVSVEDFEKMIRSGEVRDAHSIAAYALFSLVRGR
ncbi:NUDIX domain-containing protein [Cryptosporangium aurantiacum]|uniref:NUDIX domain-containing protein n=1 Tax=Cryptosporangium aurantiacum TaxID=134849 RepID=A0A1M7NFH2_9ACTN|nr:NUDIX hydrolase [Cryptosporangium aurantiacum]SHN02142.1 NUDIX domain-containing protein [Cryptosporangium aurantiacum]